MGARTHAVDSGEKQTVPVGPAAARATPLLERRGTPLDTATGAFYGERTGFDLSRVRVHTDGEAGRSALGLGASAYTIGNDIYFAPGRYPPRTLAGHRLLAHELVHTAQQSAGHGAIAPTDAAAGTRSFESTLEDEADTGAARILSGQRPHVSHIGGAEHLQRRERREPDEEETGETASAEEPGVDRWGRDSNIELGALGTYTHGICDALLDRQPAIEARASDASEVPSCPLTLILKLRFEFHLGSAPRRLGPLGEMTEEGPPWPEERAARWKGEFVRVVEDMWRTRDHLVPTRPCPDEICQAVTGQLRIVDVDDMPTIEGYEGDSSPHFNVKVFERRHWHGRHESLARGVVAGPPGAITLYESDVLEPTAEPPEGFDTETYHWMPGQAAHEIGHALGRPHIAWEPGMDVNAPESYGRTESQRADVMGRGGNTGTFARRNNQPFLLALRQITGCEWRVSSSLPWWGWLLIGLGTLLTGGLLIAGLLAHPGSRRWFTGG